MIDVITEENAAHHIRALDTMFRDRKQVFVDRLGWTLPRATPTHERDAYDTDETIYLVDIDPADGTHLGSVRLLPTTSPHVLADLFPELSKGKPLRGNGVWEVSRFCLSPRTASIGRLTASRLQLGLALIEVGLLFGISHYTACIQAVWLPRMLAEGWRLQLLGSHGDGKLAAVGIEISQGVLADLRQRTRHPRPALNWYREDADSKYRRAA